MQDDNPFATPTVPLVDSQPRQLAGWTAARLNLLGWLILAAVLGNVLLWLSSFAGAWLEQAQLQVLNDWLGVALVLLGCYLLLQLKQLAEARFNAQGLQRPVWAMVLFSLLFEGGMLLLGEPSGELDWPLLLSLAGVFMLGAISLWLGIRLLRVENVYPSFRLMAWLDIAGGVMLMSLLLALLAPLPLIGALLAQMLLFFRVAAELQET